MPIRNIHTGDKSCLKYLAYLEDGRMVRIYNAIFFYFNGTLATDTSEVNRLSYINYPTVSLTPQVTSGYHMASVRCLGSSVSTSASNRSIRRWPLLGPSPG